jgi:hypothetical protein
MIMINPVLNASHISNVNSISYQTSFMDGQQGSNIYIHQDFNLLDKTIVRINYIDNYLNATCMMMMNT